MPVPNNTPGTATEILVSALPYITSQNVLDGTIQTVYFKLRNDLARDAVVTLWFYGTIGSNPAVTYTPNHNGYTSVGLGTFVYNGFTNCPVEIPIKAGNSYWIQVFNTGAGAGTPTLNINGSLKPYSTSFPGGQIVIFAASADTYFVTQGGLHAGFITPSPNQIVNFIPFFPAAEDGDLVLSTYLIVDTSSVTQPPAASGGNYYMLLYNQSFGLITRTLISGSVVGNSHAPRIRANNTTNKFWIISAGDSGAPNRYATVSPVGVLSAVTSLANFTTGAALADCGVATNNDSHLLVCPRTTSNNYAHKWNLNTLAWDGSIGTAVANYRPTDILMLADNTVVIIYMRTSDSKSIIIRRYDLASTQLNTVTITTTDGITVSPRLGYARDAAYFWAWLPTANGVSFLKKFKASDFSLTIDTTIPNVFETSIQTATPSLIYVSDSCPIIETPSTPGVFKIVPDKRSDSNGAVDVAIPNPTFKTALLP